MTVKKPDPVNSLMHVKFSGTKGKMPEPAVDRMYEMGKALCGTTFGGKYRLIDIIGYGGMGCVFLARHLTIERRSALKVLLSEEPISQSSLRRFQLEASVLMKIDHPNIVSVLDCGRGPHDEPYIVMELLKGRDLGDLMGGDYTPVPWLVAKHIISQATAALAAAHKTNVIHRDIKPGNIFLVDPTGKCVVKVLDFGLAKLEDGKGAVEGVLGTPMYMSPEQAAGEKDYDHRTDIYSLGVVMYQMLTGHTPFESHAGTDARRIIELEEMHKDLTLPAPRFATKGTVLDLPPGAEEIVLHCLAKRPGERPASMSEVERAIKGCDFPKAVASGKKAPDPLLVSIPRESVPARLSTPGMQDIAVIRSFQELGARQRMDRRSRGESHSFVKALALLLALLGVGAGGFYIAKLVGCFDKVQVAADASVPQKDAGPADTLAQPRLDAGKKQNGKKPKPGKVKKGKKKKVGNKPFPGISDAAAGILSPKQDAGSDEDTADSKEDSKDEADNGGTDEKDDEPISDAG